MTTDVRSIPTETMSKVWSRRKSVAIVSLLAIAGWSPLIAWVYGVLWGGWL